MTVSIWQRKFEQPYEADVIIVGAGISGLGTAFWLTQRDPDLRVVVLDRDRAGAGASGRNAGFLTCGSVAHFARQIDRHGEERAWDIWALARENHALLREHFLTDDGCGYRRTGALCLLRDPARADSLAAAVERLTARGVGASTVDPASYAELTGHYAADGGRVRAWRVDDDGQIDPIALLQRIQSRCGATVYGQHEVQSIATTPRGVEVETDKLAFSATHVVVAVNAYAGELVPELARHLQPVRGQCLQTFPIGVRVEPCVYATDDWVYLRQLPDGSLVVGGHRPVDAEGEIGTEDKLNHHVHRALDETLRDRFCGLFDGEPKVARRWSGPMAYAHRGRPFAGAVPGRPGMWALGGYGGHGMGLAFVAARHLAARIIDGERSPILDLTT